MTYDPPRRVLFCRQRAKDKAMADPDPKRLEQRIGKLEAAIEEIRRALWRPRQTFPEARHEVALILQRLKERE